MFDELFVIPGQLLPSRTIDITLEQSHDSGRTVFMEASCGPEVGLRVFREWWTDDADQEVCWHVPLHRISELLSSLPNEHRHILRVLAWAAESTENAAGLRAALDAMTPTVVTFVWQH